MVGPEAAPLDGPPAGVEPQPTHAVGLAADVAAGVRAAAPEQHAAALIHRAQLEPAVRREVLAGRETMSHAAAAQHDVEAVGLAAPQGCRYPIERRVDGLRRHHGGASARGLEGPPLAQGEEVQGDLRGAQGVDDRGELCAVAVQRRQGGVGGREAVRARRRAATAARRQCRHVTLDAAARRRQIDRLRHALAGVAVALPGLVVVHHLDKMAAGVERPFDVGLVTGGAELVRRPGRERRRRIGAAVRLGVEAHCEVVQHARRLARAPGEAVPRRRVQLEVRLPLRAFDARDGVADGAGDTHGGGGRGGDLGERPIQHPRGEQRRGVAAAAPARRHPAGLALEVFEALAVPGIVETGIVVGRSRPVGYHVGVAARAAAAAEAGEAGRWQPASRAGAHG